MSDRRHALLLWLALAGLEVSWLCAWAAFVCGALRLPVCSPAQAFALYALAAGVGVQQGGSRLWHASLHVVGIAGALLSSLSAALRTPVEPVWPLTWLGRAVDRPLLTLLVCGFAAVLWQRGAWDARSERSYLVTCARFDRGLFAMLALLLFQLLMRKHLTQPGVLPGLLGVPLLACGVCALALARNRHTGQKRFASGYRGAGMLFSALSACVIAAAVSSVVLWPALQDASGAGYRGLSQVARPLAQAYADAVLYVLRMGRDRPIQLEIPFMERRPTDRASIGVAVAPHAPTLDPTLGTWGLLGIALGVLISLWLARRWLLARSSERQVWSLARLRDWLRWLLSRLLHPNERVSEPLRVYLGLLRWGRQSGAAKRGSETPREYAARLSRLSGLALDIEPIVSVFQAHAYGTEVSAASILTARQALARLRAPRHLLMRFKLRLLREAYDEPSGFVGDG